MLKDVLECQKIIDDFHKKVYEAIKVSLPDYADRIIPGKPYKANPVNATLKLPIIVDGEELEVILQFSGTSTTKEWNTSIKLDGYGEIPVNGTKRAQYCSLYKEEIPLDYFFNGEPHVLYICI